MKRGAQAAGVIVALLMAVGLGTWAFVDDMPSWKVAGLLTFVFLIVVLSVIAALVGAYHYTKLVIDSKNVYPQLPSVASTPTAATDDVTDVDFRPVPVVKPRTLRLPRYVQNGMARPMLMPAATEVVTTSEEGEEIKIELPILRRFCELNTPARSEWSGKNELYGQALAACMAQGLLVRVGKGVAWREEYPIESRRAWLRELYNSPTRSE